MKTILSLVFAALVVNACIRAGDSAWRYYRFEDAVEQEARFGASTTTSQLRRRLFELAQDNNVEVAESDVLVERRGVETYVSIQYIEAIALLPKAYTHEQAYDITMSVQPVRPLVVDDRK